MPSSLYLMSLLPNMNIVFDFRSYRTESFARYVTVESIPDEEPEVLRESFLAAEVSRDAVESRRPAARGSRPFTPCADAVTGKDRSREAARRKTYGGIRLIAAFSSTSC